MALWLTSSMGPGASCSPSVILKGPKMHHRGQHNTVDCMLSFALYCSPSPLCGEVNMTMATNDEENKKSIALCAIDYQVSDVPLKGMPQNPPRVVRVDYPCPCTLET